MNDHPPASEPHAQISCISWNIHRGRGNDGRTDANRLLDVLEREVWRTDTDALVLQEADAETPPYQAVLGSAQVEAITGLRHCQGTPLHRSSEHSLGLLGVAVFLHPSFQIDAIRLIDLKGVCPRGAVVVDATRADRPMRLIATHLALSQVLRVRQLRTIFKQVQRMEQRPLILCGDLNEWRPWGGLALSPNVLGQRLKGPARASFPVERPVLPLDRILTDPPNRVEVFEVLDGPGIRLVSDHRPVAGRVRLADPAQPV